MLLYVCAILLGSLNKCDALQQKVPYNSCYKLLVLYNMYKYYSVRSTEQSFQVKRFNKIGCKL